MPLRASRHPQHSDAGQNMFSAVRVGRGSKEPCKLMGSSGCLPIAANNLCGAEVISLHPYQKWVLIKLENVCLGLKVRYVPSLECCSGMGNQSGMFSPRKGWTCRALCL